MAINLGTEMLTFGQIFKPAMEVKTEEEAKEYFDAIVEYYKTVFGKDQQEAEKVTKINIGYWAGYYDTETRIRVYKLYKVGHPIFGSSMKYG